MKKLTNCFYLFIALLLFLGCASNKNVSYTPVQIQSLHELVDGKKFEISTNWAYPPASDAISSGDNQAQLALGRFPNQIGINGNENFLKIDGDSITAKLAYYGEFRMRNNYNDFDTGIKLDGLVENFEVDFNAKKKRYELRLEAKQDKENYRIQINILPNNQVALNIDSSSRTNIAYRGTIK